MIWIKGEEIVMKGRYGSHMKCGRMRRNKREATIGTAHTVTVNSLIESNKQTNKWGVGRRLK